MGDGDTVGRRVRAREILLLAAVLLMHGGCSILGIGLRAEPKVPIDPSAPVYVRGTADRLVGRRLDEVVVLARETRANIRLDSGTIRRVAEEAMPAVVSIYAETAEPYRVSLFPLPIPGTSFRVALPGRALGSAFFVHPDGYLLSNNHVIEGARRIKARPATGATYPLVVVARDPALDLALLRVEDTAAAGTHPYIPIGDSDEMIPGEFVVAIGNPLGLGHTVTEGIISQTGRRLGKLESRQGERHIDFLQTSAAINPGSSGGPLITLTGAVVGVNAAAIIGAEGIAFTIPSAQVRAFIATVLEGRGVAEAAH